jgi:hypothetical protein
MTVGKEMEEYVIQWANEHFFKVSALRSIANNPEKDRCETEKVLENGIKVANDSSSKHRQIRAENLMGRIIKENIKNIYPDQNSGDDGYNWSDEFEAGKVIEYGVKL